MKFGYVFFQVESGQTDKQRDIGLLITILRNCNLFLLCAPVGTTDMFRDPITCFH